MRPGWIQSTGSSSFCCVVSVIQWPITYQASLTWPHLNLTSIHKPMLFFRRWFLSQSESCVHEKVGFALLVGSFVHLLTVHVPCYTQEPSSGHRGVHPNSQMLLLCTSVLFQTPAISWIQLHRLLKLKICFCQTKRRQTQNLVRT